MISPNLSDKIEYTNGEIFCYINYPTSVQDVQTKLIVRMLYEGLPMIFALVITIVSYVMTVRKIKQLPEGVVEMLDLNVYKFFWYPGILLVTFIPSIADNFTAIYLGYQLPTAIKIMHVACTHSIGFLNSLVYGLQTRSIRSFSLDNEDHRHSKLIEGNSPDSVMKELQRARTIPY